MRASAVLATSFAFGLSNAAAAPYAADPFVDWTLEESRAFGLEMIAARLLLAETFEPPLDDELVEQLEQMTTRYFPRFGGKLTELDPELARTLRSHLETTAEAAENGGDLRSAAAEAQVAVDRAADVTVASVIRDAPAFKGALLVHVLLAEGGVAESYEEAVGNVWEYPAGWAALQRAVALWRELAPHATQALESDAEEMLRALQALFPDAGPPTSTDGWNPEEAEAPAQRLAGIVEVVADGDLFPGRDLPRLARHLAGTVQHSCEDYSAGRGELGAEGIIAAFDLYDGHLSGSAELFAALHHETAASLFDLLLPYDEEDGEIGRSAIEQVEGLSPEAACASLSRALDGIGSALGG